MDSPVSEGVRLSQVIGHPGTYWAISRRQRIIHTQGYGIRRQA
jgi:hypothetical protein